MISRPSARSRLKVLHLFRTLKPESGGPVTYWQATQSALAGSHVDAEARALDAGGKGSLTEHWRWLRRHAGDFDVLHVHGVFSWPLAFGALAARRARVPYVVSSHGHLYPWSLSQKAMRKSLYLAAGAQGFLRRAFAVVATCEREAKLLSAFDPRLHVVTVPPGLPFVTGGAREEPRHADGRLRLIFLNRFSAQKGIPVLLNAMSRLAAQGAPVHLDLVGDGDAAERSRIRAQTRLGGLRGHVTESGFRFGAAKAAALADADVFILPSNMENFSFATAEALAAGLPVVVSDAVALADEVRRYDCGTVVPTGDDEALADAVLRYLEPDLLRLQSRNALRCARECFGLGTMREALQRLYGKAAESDARP